MYKGHSTYLRRFSQSGQNQIVFKLNEWTSFKKDLRHLEK